MKKINIIIPAHNEEKRIEKTVRAYDAFFAQKRSADTVECELVIVLNGCTDNTLAVVHNLKTQCPTPLHIIVTTQAGKGLALRMGFNNALTRNDIDYIGFVDADMSTQPEAFYDLVENMHTADGVIASRYMPGAQISPKRPFYKRWGSRLIYEPFVYGLFGLTYYDLQCGAKIFQRTVIEKIVPHLMVKQWAFDAELLYLCKKYSFNIAEIPTVWTDQEGSKLTVKAGLRMFGALFDVWKHHRHH
jgi:dolichyl-phosphate beta-glucosyltransferase